MVENGVSYPKPVTLAEALIEGDIQQKKSFADNGWNYDKELNIIHYKVIEHFDYQIDLCKIDKLPKDKRAYEILDWIYHVVQKTWTTDKVLTDLIGMFVWIHVQYLSYGRDNH